MGLRPIRGLRTPARQVAIFGILAIGQLFVILTVGIDLSDGSVLGLAGAVTAQLLATSP
jgi:ribose transport system permease protein